MSRLTVAQEATLIRLFKSPAKRGCVRVVTARALIRKGYIEPVGKPDWLYQLTQAGIRYYQTGKTIGE